MPPKRFVWGEDGSMIGEPDDPGQDVMEWYYKTHHDRFMSKAKTDRVTVLYPMAEKEFKKLSSQELRKVKQDFKEQREKYGATKREWDRLEVEKKRIQGTNRTDRAILQRQMVDREARTNMLLLHDEWRKTRPNVHNGKAPPFIESRPIPSVASGCGFGSAVPGWQPKELAVRAVHMIGKLPDDYPGRHPDVVKKPKRVRKSLNGKRTVLKQGEKQQVPAAKRPTGGQSASAAAAGKQKNDGALTSRQLAIRRHKEGGMDAVLEGRFKVTETHTREKMLELWRKSKLYKNAWNDARKIYLANPKFTSKKLKPLFEQVTVERAARMGPEFAHLVPEIDFKKMLHDRDQALSR